MNDRSTRHEQWVSWTLRGGVWFSAGLLVAGLFTDLMKTAGEEPSRNLSLGDFVEILTGNLDASVGETVLYAGIVALLLTPVLRVFSAAVMFIAERDVKFTVVSLSMFMALVVEILLSSF